MKRILILEILETNTNTLKELRINESFEEIKQISKGQFNKILKKRIYENALCYLKKKQNIKGKEISYENIELADYLQPYNNLSIEEKQKIFEMRNKMTKIPNNFLNGAKKTKCFCGEEEEMAHVYECNILSSNKSIQIEYEEIYRNNPMKQKEILQRFERNLEKRQKIQDSKNELRKEIFTKEKRKIPCDLLLDPLNFKRFSFG